MIACEYSRRVPGSDERRLYSQAIDMIDCALERTRYQPVVKLNTVFSRFPPSAWQTRIVEKAFLSDSFSFLLTKCCNSRLKSTPKTRMTTCHLTPKSVKAFFVLNTRRFALLARGFCLSRLYWFRLAFP